MGEPYATTANYDPSDYEIYGGDVYEGVVYWSHLELLEINDNASQFEAYCEHVTINFVVLNTGDYADLETSFANGDLSVLTSYDINFEAMQPSAFTLLSQLITFQNPDFGIENDFGDLIEYGMGLGFWICFALLAFTLITRMIPTIQGGLED